MSESTGKLVECVPNFSEGRDGGKIRQITEAVESVAGVTLLDVEANIDYNRVVVTFVGKPEEIKEAAFRSIAKAAELIDMSVHKGLHPRMGAADVCPFIPVSGVTMEDCAGLAVSLGREVGERLGIPVYLYGRAARKPDRAILSNVRRGEYEGLAEKLKDPEWIPDFGPSELTDTAKKSGAVAIGARKLLIAYNITLDTSDAGIAKKIAGRLRESGTVTKSAGKKTRIPGRLKKVQAMGALMKSGLTEVSMNLLDYDITPLHVAFEAVKAEAEQFGVTVKYSEIIGLVTKEPLLMAGRFYRGEGDGSDREVIGAAVTGLKLMNFDPEKKIIEYAAGL